MVTVLTDTETQSITRVFMIPVIAGSGVVAESAQAAAAPGKSADSARAR
jgi:hypothetical protein